MLIFLFLCFKDCFGIFGQRLYNGHLFHWENMWAEVNGGDEGRGGGRLEMWKRIGFRNGTEIWRELWAYYAVKQDCMHFPPEM